MWYRTSCLIQGVWYHCMLSAISRRKSIPGMDSPVLPLPQVLSGCAGCIGRAQTSLEGQIKHACARGVLPAWYLLCNFSEQDNIAYAVSLTCQTCFARRIYLSGTILDITLQNLWCIRHFQIHLGVRCGQDLQRQQATMSVLQWIALDRITACTDFSFLFSTSW